MKEKEVIIINYDNEDYKSTKYDGYYVSINGKVLSTRSGKKIIMKHCINWCGHHSVPIKVNKKEIGVFVHRLVYETWKEPILNGNVIDHIDANTHNNNLNNLRQCTQKQNIQYAIENGNFGSNGKRNVIIKRKFDGKILEFESLKELAEYIGKPQSNGGSRFLIRDYFTKEYELIYKK